MPVGLGSNTISAAFAKMQTDQLTITRRVAPATGRTFTTSLIYGGPGDIQESNGTAYYNPAGVAEIADARLIISGTAAQPAQIGDIVTRQYDGKTWIIQSEATKPWTLNCSSFNLKRGGLQDDQK